MALDAALSRLCSRRVSNTATRFNDFESENWSKGFFVCFFLTGHAFADNDSEKVVYDLVGFCSFFLALFSLSFLFFYHHRSLLFFPEWPIDENKKQNDSCKGERERNGVSESLT